MTPASVFVLESGGLESLVALTPLLRAMNRAWPRARVTVGCRQSLTGIESLWPAKASTVSIGEAPGAAVAMSRDLVEEMSVMLATLQSVEADWFVCAEPRPDWFARVVAAWFGAQRSIFLGGEPPEIGLANVLIREMTLGAIRAEKETPAGLSLDVEPEPAQWTLPPRVRETSLERLEQLGLRERSYLTCVPEPRWGRARYGEAIEAIRAETNIPVLILGEGDSPVGSAVRCFQPGSMPAAAGMLALSRAWLTGDAGRAALANAYGVKGAWLQGGGDPDTGAASVSHPMPCAGCGWDCLFSAPVCMDLIPVIGSARQVQVALTGTPPPPMKLDALTPLELALIAKADARYRSVARENRELRSRLIEIEYERENSRPRRR